MGRDRRASVLSLGTSRTAARGAPMQTLSGVSTPSGNGRWSPRARLVSNGGARKMMAGMPGFISSRRACRPGSRYGQGDPAWQNDSRWTWQR